MRKLFTLLCTVILATPFIAYGQLTTQQGGTGTSSPIGILFGDGTLHLKTVKIGSNLTFSGGTLSASGGGSSFGYPFPNNATTTGLLLLASTTIGASSQTTGLTINGGSTTTLNAYFAGSVGIATSSPESLLTIQSNKTGDDTPAFTIDGSATSQGNGDMELEAASGGTAEANIDLARAGTMEWQIGIQNGGGATGNDFELWDGSNNPVFSVNHTSLDINIGTTTCGGESELCVWGDGGTSGNIFQVITAASSSALSVSNTGFATTTLSGLTISGSATSTSNVGWNITAGCYAISGTCIGQNAGTVTSVSGTTNQISSTGGTTPVLSLTSPVIFPGSFEAFASSTIGNGTQQGGLTINGGATTTNGATLFSYAVAGDVTPAFQVDASGSGLNTVAVFTVRVPSTGGQKAFQLLMGNNTTAWAQFGYDEGGTNKQGLSFGPGSASRDVGIARDSAGVLRITNSSSGNGSLLALATSTIGAGGQSTGLTINGGATTTLNAYFATNVLVGTTSINTTSLLVQAASSTVTTTPPFDLWAPIAGTLFDIQRIDEWGHLITSGNAPSVSGGTSSVAGNDRNGTITVTGTALTSVTLTFAHAYATAPDCTESDNSTALTADISSVSASSITFAFSIGVASLTIWYQCAQHI